MALSYTNDSATISTSEYSLPADTTSGVPTSQTSDGIYQIYIDFNDMISGDQYVVKLYEKVSGSSNSRLMDEWIFTGVQSKPLFVMPSLILGEGWDITVKQLVGGAKRIAWSIRKVS